MSELLPFSKLLRITDGLGRIRRQLSDVMGEGTSIGVGYSKMCELVTINQTGADGLYTIRARDFVNSFAVGDNIGYWVTATKIPYTESLTIKSISGNIITANGKFTAAPGVTDFLILFETLVSVAGVGIRDYILALNVADQENDLLGASMGAETILKGSSSIHPLVRGLINSLSAHYPNGINNHLDNHTDPIISAISNAPPYYVDLPDDYAKWFVAGDIVTYYDVSLGYRILDNVVVTSVGVAGSGTASGTTRIVLTSAWTVPPIVDDYLILYDRLCPEFKLLCDKIGLTLTAGRVYPAEVNFGTYAATSGIAGTFTDGDAVDTTNYGGADLEVEVINQAIGVNNLTLSITAKYYDAAGVSQTDTLAVVVPLTSVVGTRVTIAPVIADARYYDITAITNSTGNNGDNVKIVSKLDRKIRRS